MRNVTALLCFSLIFSAAWAADPTPSPTDTYIMARDRYIAELTARPASGLADKREDRAMADLERHLSALIPAWKAHGFPTRGRISLSTLDRHSLGFGLLDGLSYQTRDTIVTVTTVPLIKRWLADNRQVPSGRPIPQSLEAALRSEPFYEWAIEVDVAALFYGDLPVRKPAGVDMAMARLTIFAQELVLDGGPNRIVVTVARGDRVLIAEQEVSVSPAPVCRPALSATLAKADVVGKRRGKMSDDEYRSLLAKADRDYRACFAAHLRQQPHYKAIVRQAQALVDLLH